MRTNPDFALQYKDDPHLYNKVIRGIRVRPMISGNNLGGISEGMIEAGALLLDQDERGPWCAPDWRVLNCLNCAVP